jgi:predicted 2-oxoglutarate/Fe(II)-dependent dioxygenase YbiX
MNKLEDLIFVGNNIDVIDSLKSYIENSNLKLKSHGVDAKQKFTKNQRACDIAWIPCNKDNIVNDVLTNFLISTNELKWKLSLSNWQCNIQYTYYHHYNHHYDWHTDVLDNSNPNLKRLITIVYCLTPKINYKGCKLEIKYNDEIFSKKLDIGDYVVFPSDLTHRVTQLITGEREVLVGWYK